MAVQIDYNDPRYAQAAAEILRRHDNGEPEANITSAVRDFLIVTGLVRGDEVVEENPPAQGSRRAVDLAALDTFIEFKRRIGTAGGFNPNAEYVQQLDDYLEQSEEQDRMRMGILTDGRRWLLRWPNAGPVRTGLPYAFTLEDADRWITLFEWLRVNYRLEMGQNYKLKLSHKVGVVEVLPAGRSHCFLIFYYIPANGQTNARIKCIRLPAVALSSY